MMVERRVFRLGTSPEKPMIGSNAVRIELDRNGYPYEKQVEAC